MNHPASRIACRSCGSCEPGGPANDARAALHHGLRACRRSYKSYRASWRLGRRGAQVPYLRARVSCSATNSCDSLCFGSRWIIGLACSCDSLILIEADR